MHAVYTKSQIIHTYKFSDMH